MLVAPLVAAAATAMRATVGRIMCIAALLIFAALTAVPPLTVAGAAGAVSRSAAKRYGAATRRAARAGVSVSLARGPPLARGAAV